MHTCASHGAQACFTSSARARKQISLARWPTRQRPLRRLALAAAMAAAWAARDSTTCSHAGTKTLHAPLCMLPATSVSHQPCPCPLSKAARGAPTTEAAKVHHGSGRCGRSWCRSCGSGRPPRKRLEESDVLSTGKEGRGQRGAAARPARPQAAHFALPARRLPPWNFRRYSDVHPLGRPIRRFMAA